MLGAVGERQARVVMRDRTDRNTHEVVCDTSTAVDLPRAGTRLTLCFCVHGGAFEE